MDSSIRYSSSARYSAPPPRPIVQSLFDESADLTRAAAAPLAARMRPRTLDEFVGQSEAVGPGTWLRRAIDADALSSVILYGPAGTGKTSLARIIAAATKARFEEVSAVTGGVAELRKAIAAANDRLGLTGQRTILFIDEIHRFSKSQQDALLHAVEDRIVILVGATTENPFFEVNAPLISRSRVVELLPLSDAAVGEIVRRAVTDDRGLAGRVVLDPAAEKAIVLTAGAMRALRSPRSSSRWRWRGRRRATRCPPSRPTPSARPRRHGSCPTTRPATCTTT